MSPINLSKIKIAKNSSPENTFRNNRKRGWNLVFVSLIITLSIFFIHQQFFTAPKVFTSKVTVIQPSQQYTVLNASGYVVPQRQAALSSKAQGRLEWLGVLEGSKVQKGQIIARLEKEDVEAALQQAIAQKQIAQANLNKGRADLREANLNLKRSAELLDKQFIPQAQHDENLSRVEKIDANLEGLKATLKSADANIKAAEIAVNQTIITAPFDGIVLTKSANVGDNITPFSSAADSKGAVVTIADMKTLEVEADVSEAKIHQIKIDQPCEVLLEAIPERRFSAVVSRMVPTVNRSKATILVKIRFTESDPRILPDMSAKVAFLEKKVPSNEKKPVTVVPPESILKRASGYVVFKIIDNYTSEIPVLLGKKINGKMEVSGVSAGDQLVLNPSAQLKTGTRVELR